MRSFMSVAVIARDDEGRCEGKKGGGKAAFFVSIPVSTTEVRPPLSK